ncbi:MAG: TetR/AcrR family transcriptional regulator [Trueperaceae bacterium]|jgi:AcrR family transcriptional regulator
MTDNAAPSASERLLDAAARLFYTRGVPNVGINEIIARAGVARMTFYHHFPSKDDLIKAVLERRRVERAAWLAQADERASTPRGQILAVFDLLSEWFTAPDYRGCPLLAATFELGGQLNAARPYARAHHEAVRAYFAARLEAAGVPDSGALAAQLHLLLEGATVVALVQGGPAAEAAARAAAEALVP